MQAYVSTNTADIQLRDAVRNELQSKVDVFLQSKEITFLETRTVPRVERPAYNSAISVSPLKAKQVSTDREDYAAQVRELSTIEIHGIPIKRSATEIAKIMRQRGYKVRSTSVMRIADSIGIKVFA